MFKKYNRENICHNSYNLNSKQTSVAEIHLYFQACVVVYVNCNERASAKRLNHFSTFISIQPLHIYKISRHYCICLC
jgi:hypothetical protein